MLRKLALYLQNPSTSGANPIRNFDGQIAQVAFWTNALTAAQIQGLFNAADVPPLFHSQPVGATASQGSDVTIAANATGSSLTFQWYDNGAAVPGQTGDVLDKAAGGKSVAKVNRRVAHRKPAGLRCRDGSVSH